MERHANYMIDHSMYGGYTLLAMVQDYRKVNAALAATVARQKEEQ